MGYVRLFRRMRVAPGIRLNLSKSGPSVSLGVRGAHLTFGRRGVTKTVGLPGTGLFYTSPAGHHTGVHTAAAFAPSADAGGGSVPRHRATGCLLWLVGIVVLLALIGRFCAPPR